MDHGHREAKARLMASVMFHVVGHHSVEWFMAGNGDGSGYNGTQLWDQSWLMGN